MLSSVRDNITVVGVTIPPPPPAPPGGGSYTKASDHLDLKLIFIYVHFSTRSIAFKSGELKLIKSVLHAEET